MINTKHFLIGISLLCLFSQTIPAQSFDIYISDAGNFNNPPWQILKFDQNGQNGVVFTTEHLAWPQDIVFLEDKNEMLISNLNSGEISRHNATTGAYINSFATGISGPTRMKIGPDSLLYVLQWQGDGKVRTYNLDGTFAGNFTQTNVTNSIGLDWDNSGNLYVSSYNGKYVRKFSPAGFDLGNFISTGLQGPTNIYFDDTGDLVVLDYVANVVKKYNSIGDYKGVFITAMPKAEGVDFLPNKNILMGCGPASSIREFAPDGSFVKTFILGGTLGLKTPNAVVIRHETISKTKDIAQDTKLVIPNIGDVFQLAEIDSNSFAAPLELINVQGVIIRKIQLSSSSTIDLSDLPIGTYYLVGKLKSGTSVRQKLIVQH
ncbi:MAG: T9SS type A sorting domain-containing protein [Lewinellaceae bacterium]|nr:T9SS type A sorting domain-containing protein [Saprospiraceae bacterium]MCB9343818.1 T9SS type A sorting domain-containing protein [Lewinellaceae bacterium]